MGRAIWDRSQSKSGKCLQVLHVARFVQSVVHDLCRCVRERMLCHTIQELHKGAARHILGHLHGQALPYQQLAMQRCTQECPTADEPGAGQRMLACSKPI